MSTGFANISNIYKQYVDFSPLDITGCVLWLDPTDASCVTQTNNTITTLTDKSFIQNNATANGTVLWGGTNTLNSLSCLRFGGASYLTLTGSKLPYQPSSSFSVFIASKIESSAATSQVVFSWGSFSNNAAISLYYFSHSQVISLFNGSSTYQSFTAGRTSPYMNSKTNLWTAIGRSGVAPTLQGWCNGYYNAYNSASTGAFVINTGSVTACIGANNNGSNFLTGSVGDIIVYNRHLNPIEQMNVEGYLAWKYGIPRLTSSNLDFQSISTFHAFNATKPITRDFSPVDLPSCTLWLDAMTGPFSVTYDGFGYGLYRVNWWKDKSGQGLHAFQTGLRGPDALIMTAYDFSALTYPTHAYAVNQVQFNWQGNVSQSLMTPVKLSSTANHHLVGVYYTQTPNPASIASLTRLFSWQTATTPYIAYPYITPSTGVQRGYVTSYDGTALNSVTSALKDNYAGTEIISEACILSGSQTIYKDGVLQSSNTQALTAASTTVNLCIGALNSSSQWFGGSIQELLVYNNALDNLYRQRLESHLFYKWWSGNSLPNSVTTSQTFFFKNYVPRTTLFNPMCFQSCTLWLDPSDSSTLVGYNGTTATQIKSKVCGWNSLSNNVFKKYDDSSFPVIQYSSKSLNGIYINSIPLISSNSNFLQSGSFTFFMVGNTSNTLGQFQFDVTNSVANTNFSVNPGSQSNGMLRFYSSSFYDFQNRSNTSITPNQWFVLSCGYQYATSLSEGYRINFTQRSSTAVAVLPTFGGYSNTAIIGSSNSLTSAASATLGELIIYKGKLNAPQMTLVEGYLAHKWGLNGLLPDNHPYKTFTSAVQWTIY